MRTCFTFFLSFLHQVFLFFSKYVKPRSSVRYEEDNEREQVRLGQEQEDEAIPSNNGEAETATQTVHINIMTTVLPPRPSNLNGTPNSRVFRIPTIREPRVVVTANSRRQNDDGVRYYYGNNDGVESSTVGQQQETIPNDHNSSSTGNGGGGDVDREGSRRQQPTNWSYSLERNILVVQNVAMRLRELAREDGGPEARHASKEAVENLEVVKIDNEGGLNTPTMVCAVCLDEIPVGSEAKKMPCKHVYHGDCIVNWLNNSNVCPMCRFELPLA